MEDDTQTLPPVPAPASAHALMLGSLTSYFQKHTAHRRMLHDLIEGRTAISLRLLDWFVTHYAKKNNVLYWLDASNNFNVNLPPGIHDGARKFTVYTEYRAQLRAFSKHAFDPFRRHNRISFVVNERPDNSPIFVDTTVGQLNFFRWALQNKVIDYVLRNLSVIEDDMASFQQSRRVTPLQASQKTKTPTPQSAPTHTQQDHAATTRALPPTRIHFD